MTAIPKDARVTELREMFRFLPTFRVLHETSGVDEIVNDFGNAWSLWDLEYLYSQTKRLNLAQRRAITLCLVNGMLERDAAIAMGVGENNPVGMYASLGLRRLLDMQETGQLDRFRDQAPDPLTIAGARAEFLANLAAFIRSRCKVTEGHWLFPCRPGSAPSVLVRSPQASSGFLSLHPRVVLYETEREPLRPDFDLVHADEGPEACVNPDHADTRLTDAARARLRARLRSHTRRIA